MKPVKKNALEWTVFTIGLLVVITLISYLIYQIITDQKQPPYIQVTVKPESALPPYTYHVLLRNTGGETAMNVTAEFTLQNKDVVVEKTQLVIDHLPKGSQKEGWIVFSTNPQQTDTLLTKVVSFLKP